MIGRLPRRVLALVVVVFALACNPGEGPHKSPPSAPSIVFVTVDTLRADHLGCYGYFRETSPTIDSLADESVRFKRAVSPMATTLPAHVSLWTSQYPIQTGITRNGKQVDHTSQTGVRLFAQMLQDLGYTTAAFVSGTPVKSFTGLAEGFEVWSQPRGSRRRRTQRSALRTTESVLEWLRADPVSPFFLWIHYFDPHLPYAPPAPFNTAFKTTRGLLDFLDSVGIDYEARPDLLKVANSYDGEILFMDTQLARVIDALKTKGLYNELVFVVASDHGEGLGQHGHMEHGEIHNEQLLVPLIIKYPLDMGLGGRTIEHLVSLIDVIPTLVGTLDLDLPSTDTRQFVGMNVLEPDPVREFAFAQRTTNSNRPWKTADRFALVGRRWKFSHDTVGGELLFDLASDPAEMTSVVADRPDIAERLRHRLFLKIAEYSESEKSFKVLEVKSPEVLDELRALGYIQ